MSETPQPDQSLDLSAEAEAEGPLAASVVLTGTPSRPDITPAQIVSGIPIVAELLHAYGVYDLSQAQQDSLGKAVTWAIAVAGADAVIRLGRNLARRL